MGRKTSAICMVVSVVLLCFLPDAELYDRVPPLLRCTYTPIIGDLSNIVALTALIETDERYPSERTSHYYRRRKRLYSLPSSSSEEREEREDDHHEQSKCMSSVLPQPTFMCIQRVYTSGTYKKNNCIYLSTLTIYL